MSDEKILKPRQRISFMVLAMDLANSPGGSSVPRIPVRITLEAPGDTSLAVFDEACKKAEEAFQKRVWGTAAASPVGELVDPQADEVASDIHESQLGIGTVRVPDTLERCLSLIREAPECEDASAFVLEAIELAKELKP